MLRKVLITLMAVAALGVGSTAMARGGGGHGGSFGGGGGHGGGFGGGGGHGGGFAGSSASHGGGFGGGAMRGGGIGHTVHGGGMVRAPMVSGRVQGFSGRTFNRNNFAFNRGFRDHRHHRFHNRNVFAFGFAGPFVADYGYYDNCWRPVRTYYGLRWAYVCGDYPYWSY